MKKYFYLFLSLFTVVLFSCNQNNPSDPTNPSDPSDPSNPSVVSKVKYTTESASWYTYQNTDNGTQWGVGLNVVSKYVYERGSESKYIMSQSSYYDDELKSKTTYQNESDRDYSWVSYPSGSESNRDTTIWYDAARSKQKEIRTKTYRSVYEYDSQHNDRQVSTKTYYHYDNSWTESNFTYDGLIRHGETKSYNKDGKLTSVQRGTYEYLDDSYTRLKSWEIEVFTYISESQSYHSTTLRTRQEWNDKLWTKNVTETESFDPNGNQIQTTRTTNTCTWKDELNNTTEMEMYINGTLWCRQSGYNKLTY